MRTFGALCVVLVLAGAAQATGLRLRVVDAGSGAPVAGVTVQRWASQWQPRILLPPGKFWFPEGSSTTDAVGVASFEKVARDDRYYITAKQYERGVVTRRWLKFQFSGIPDGSPRDVIEQSGTLVVTLRPSTGK